MRKGVSGRYYMPETMPLVLCGDCLKVVLENSEKAMAACKEVVDSYRRPDCEEAFKKLGAAMPKGKSLVDEATRALGLSPEKMKLERDLWLPDASTLSQLKVVGHFSLGLPTNQRLNDA